MGVLISTQIESGNSSIFFVYICSFDKKKQLTEPTANIKDTPQYYLNKLKTEPDLETLTSLRISLSTEPLIWLNSFRSLKGIPEILRIMSETEKNQK